MAAATIREALLREALRHLTDVTDDGICEFLYNRRAGETCSAARSRMKGSPLPGCSHCQAQDFLIRAKKER